MIRSEVCGCRNQMVHDSLMIRNDILMNYPAMFFYKTRIIIANAIILSLLICMAMPILTAEHVNFNAGRDKNNG